MLSVWPVATRPPSVSAMLPGSTSAAESPSRMLRRNRSTITIAKNAPIRSASRTPPTDEETKSAWSYHVSTWTSDGSAPLWVSNQRRTAFDSSTVLPVGLRRKLTSTASCPCAR